MDVRYHKHRGKRMAGIGAVLAIFLVGIAGLHAWEESADKRQSAAIAEQKLNENAAHGSIAYEDDAYETDAYEDVYYNGAWYRLREELETVLVLGVDKYAKNRQPSGNGKYEQSDFLMLLVIDRDAEQYTALHLNRDTMTEYQILTDTGVPVRTVTGQLTLAHTYGGSPKAACRNTLEAVSNLLYGMEIEHYISISMDGVAELNDLAGGVTVEVMDDFTGIDSTLIQGETVTLRGQQALTYVRTRFGLEDSSNLHRMERQRQYLEALQKKVEECAERDPGFPLTALLQVNEYLESDYTAEQMADLAERVSGYEMADYLTLDGEAVYNDPYMEFYVDEEAVQELIMRVFYEEVM